MKWSAICLRENAEEGSYIYVHERIHDPVAVNVSSVKRFSCV